MSGPRLQSMFVLVLLSVPLLVAGQPAAGQQPAPGHNLVLQDAVGDPSPIGGGLPPTPVGDAYGHVDIQFLEIGNDEADTFQVILGIGGYANPGQTAAQALALQDFYCRVSWTYDHDESDVDYTYRLYISSDLLRQPGEAEPGDVDLYYSMYYREGDDYHGVGREWDPERFVFDEARSALVFTVPKSWSPVWPGGHMPGGGDRLLPDYAYCSTDILLYGSVYDFLEIPQGARYAFPGLASGGQVLQVGLDRPEDGDVGADPFTWEPPSGEGAARRVTSVAPGMPTKVPVYIANDAASRKLVQLSASFLDAAPEGWNLTLTPSVMVPAGQIRTVHLIVTPPPGAALGAAFPIEIRAQATGEPLGASTATDLRVTPLLDAQHNTFFIHTQKMDTSNPVNEAAAQLFPPYRIAASLLEAEPGYDDEPASISPVSGFSGRHLLSPLVRPVRLDVTEPVQVTVAFDGDAARGVDVEMYLFTDSGTLLALRETVPGDGATTIEAFLDSEDDVLELAPGTDVYFEMRVIPSGIGPESVGSTAFVAAESRFSLPVMEGGESLVVTDGRFLPSLALGRGEDATTYVNPGSEYAFDLVLSNEGVETDDLRLSVNATNATGWDVAFKPGEAFRVQPGNSTPFSLVVVAPADAVEGDRAVFDITVRSKHDPAVRTELRLAAVVTTGVQVDAKPYEEREGQLDPLAEERGEAAGLPAVALVAALVALAGAIRRRH